MRPPIENEILRFLTNEQNADSVLEILSRMDELREMFFNQFWSRVLDTLSKSRPAHLPESVLTLEPRESNWQFAGINGYFNEFPRTTTQLFYNYEQVIWDKRNMVEIYYGLHWVGKVPDSSPFQQIPEVAALKECQKKMGFVFDKNPEFHGWKYLGEGGVKPETILSQARGPGGSSLITQIVDDFWAYIGKTHQEVIAANRAILKAAHE